MTVRSCLLAGWLGCLGAGFSAPVAMAQGPERGEPRRINLVPAEAETASASNQRNADAVASALSRDSRLRGYEINVVAVDGVVALRGKVADAAQRDIAGQTALAVTGVNRVENQLHVGNAPISQASQEFVPPAPIAVDPLLPNGAVPPVGGPVQIIPPGGPFQGPPPGIAMPLPPGGPLPNGALAPEPVPVYQNQPGMLPNPQYQPPPMPPYAWPSYAPYNNYSRVAHPLLYAYNQWPFIGPMYPYPKVPLGWRKVSLEWQDGAWWYGRESTSHAWWRVRYW